MYDCLPCTLSCVSRQLRVNDDQPFFSQCTRGNRSYRNGLKPYTLVQARSQPQHWRIVPVSPANMRTRDASLVELLANIPCPAARRVTADRVEIVPGYRPQPFGWANPKPAAPGKAGYPRRVERASAAKADTGPISWRRARASA